MKSRITFLVVSLSFGVFAETKFTYGGPFIVDALKSNEGLVEMVVPRGAPIAVVFKGCDYAKSVYEDSKYMSSQLQSDGKSVIISNSFPKSTQEVFPVNIKTKEGLMHTIALVPALEGYSLSKINLKLVIENDFECSHR